MLVQDRTLQAEGIEVQEAPAGLNARQPATRSDADVFFHEQSLAHVSTALSGRLPVEKLLRDFETLIEQFIDLVEMIIEAIVKEINSLINSLFEQLERVCDVIAQHLEMTPEEELPRFTERLRPLAKFVADKRRLGFPHSAVDPLALFNKAQGKVYRRIARWIEEEDMVLFAATGPRG